LLLIRGILAAPRQVFHLSACPNLAGHLCWHRAQKLARCRELLGMAAGGSAADPPGDYRDRFEALTGQSLRECPHCHLGLMVVIDCIARPAICQPVPDTSSRFRIHHDPRLAFPHRDREAPAGSVWRGLRRNGRGRR
jgi:hypothetical protein